MIVLLCYQNEEVRGRFQGLVLNVVLNGTSIDFEPSYTGVEVVVLNAFDKILDAVSSIPRVETKLYPSDSKAAAKSKLKPVIAEEILEGAKAQVRGCCGYLARGVGHVRVIGGQGRESSDWFTAL